MVIMWLFFHWFYLSITFSTIRLVLMFGSKITTYNLKKLIPKAHSPYLLLEALFTLQSHHHQLWHLISLLPLLGVFSISRAEPPRNDLWATEPGLLRDKKTLSHLVSPEGQVSLRSSPTAPQLVGPGPDLPNSSGPEPGEGWGNILREKWLDWALEAKLEWSSLGAGEQRE